MYADRDLGVAEPVNIFSTIHLYNGVFVDIEFPQSNLIVICTDIGTNLTEFE